MEDGRKETDRSRHGQPQLGFKWACEIDDAKSWRDLSESGPFPVTDLNLATAINKIKGGAIRNKIDIADEECDRQNRMMMGRQMLWIYYDENRIASVDKSIVDWSTLLDCKYKNGNLSGFWHEWTMILNNLVDQPSEELKETLFKKEILKEESLKLQLQNYDMQINFPPYAKKSYQQLTDFVQLELEVRSQRKNRDAMLRTHDGRQGHAGVKRADVCPTGSCRTFFKHGDCSKGSTCPFTHDTLKKDGKDKKGKGKGKDGGRSTTPKGKRE